MIGRKGMCLKLQPFTKFLEVKIDRNKTSNSFNAE